MTTLFSFFALLLRDHVVGREDLAERVGEHPHPEAGRAGQRRAERVGRAEHRDPAGVVRRERHGRDAVAVGAAVLPWLKITIPTAPAAAAFSAFSSKVHVPTLEQRDVARREAGEVGRLAAAGRRVAEPELQVDRASPRR